MYTLPKLPYDYNALEPFVDEATMRLHHGKHHQAYCDKLNATLEKYPDLMTNPAEELLVKLNDLPEEIRVGVRNFGGGYVNHNFFWQILNIPKENNLLDQPGPVGGLAKKIDEQFGSFADFKKQLSDRAIGLFGSGWAWLVFDKGKLAITTTINQDSPLSLGQISLLTIDVWEHAYYLKYQNRRAEYVEAIWSVFNWFKIAENYDLALKS
jgi:Fe-Mn family superoxide dismutase